MDGPMLMDVDAPAKLVMLDEAREMFEAERLADAAVVLRELATVHPEDCEIMNDLGVVTHAKGSPFEAESILTSAHERSPENLEIRINLARVSLSLGMFGRAIALAESVIEEGGDVVTARQIASDARAGEKSLTLYPRFVSIETASVCNAKCHFCSTPDVKRKAFMDEDVWKKIIDDNREAGIELRLNMDGEPTLYRELPRLIEYAKTTTNCTVTFNTNGERLDPEFGKAILEAGVDGVRFSVDGFRKETYERHRIGLDYHKVVANIVSYIGMAEKYSSFVELRMIRMADNEDERDGFAQFWTSFPGVKVIFTTPYNWPSIGYESVPKPCGRGEDDFEIYYFTDGRATLCCMDWKEEAVLGDSRKYSTREIWNSPLARRWRKDLRDGRRNNIPLCSGCNQDLSQDVTFEVS